MNSKWKWDVDLEPMIGKTVHIITKDGFEREGKITAVKTRDVTINNKLYVAPFAIELNGDPIDIITFVKMENMDLVEISNDDSE